MKRGSFNFAFTLLELVLVLAIISIAVMVAAPSLAGFGRGRNVENTAANLVSLTHWARSLAISQGQTVRLKINTQSGQCEVTTERRGVFVKMDHEKHQRFTMPEDVKISSLDVPQEGGAYVIEFDPSGYTTPGTFEITGKVGTSLLVSCESKHDTYHVAREEAGS